MSEGWSIGRWGDSAIGAGAPIARASSAPPGGRTLQSSNGPMAQSLLCNRCHFPVYSRPWGCKNPCPNCGTVYPLGDCSD